MSGPTLTTIPRAIELCGFDPEVVTVAVVRGRIKRGECPATKLGKHYVVDPQDLARLFAPTLREGKPRKGERESERARIQRQLAEAGVG